MSKGSPHPSATDLARSLVEMGDIGASAVSILSGYSRQTLHNKTQSGELTGYTIAALIDAIVTHGWNAPGDTSAKKTKRSVSPFHSDLSQASTIEEYDALIGMPETWDEATKRERTRGEIERNERERLDTARAKGEVIAVVDARNDAARIAATFTETLNQLGGMLTNSLRGQMPTSDLAIVEAALARIVKSELRRMADTAK